MSFCAYLRCAGQCEQQVKCCLGKVKVTFGSQAELDCTEDRGKNWNLLHYGHPVLTILISSTQFLCQMQCQNTHLATRKVRESILKLL